MKNRSVSQSSMESNNISKTPTILIQDPRNSRCYLLDAVDLNSYLLTKEKLMSLNAETITFVVPEDNLLDLTPPFSKNFTNTPSIIIQHHSQEKSYFIPTEELVKYLVQQPESLQDGYDVSFILPHGTELIEELPEMMKGLLQSGER